MLAGRTSELRSIAIDVPQRSQALGFYRWPQSWRASFVVGGVAYQLDLVLAERKSIGNWIVGGFSMGIAKGELRHDVAGHLRSCRADPVVSRYHRFAAYYRVSDRRAVGMLERPAACVSAMVKLFSLFKRFASATAIHRTTASTPTTPTTQTDWSRFRRRQRREDQVLSALTYAWLKTLPYAVRPVELCTRYPRVGNRLARCWTDPAQTERLFDDLLVDRRGKRKGFPPPVAEELVRLRRFHEHHRGVEDQSTVWDFRPPTSER